ncbi:hypothetical protein AB0G79_22840 [Streptomyces sp. NPDC020807]|uniref:hypothetical protein n=1 Tax=Streptomyces sp. NPDC020807 TaxID=3155119 RepID=UPI0034066827
MPSALPADTRRLLLVACAVTALVAGSVGWYAGQTVSPECTFATSSLGSGEDREAAVERAYHAAVGAGDCAPPHARWRFWRD